MLGGAALVLVTVTITVINSSFGVLDNLLFFGGLAGLVVTLVALAVHLSARASGAARLGRGVLAFIGILIVLAALSQLMDTMGRHIFSATNVGLHGELGVFTVGVALLTIATWARRR